jgi:hypothetical protein
MKEVAMIDTRPDKWEMCYLNFLGNQLKFYSPGKTPNYKSCEKYVLSKGGSENVWYGADVVIPLLLNDGWEPFAVQNNQEYVFKRMANSESPAGRTDFLGKP